MRNATLFVAALSLAAAAAACTDEDDTVDVAQAVAGTPDELALVRLLNDPATTVSVLDDQVPLDRRAATNLIAHRDGGDATSGTPDDDLYDSAAEADAVAYVGPSAMSALLDFALAGDWVRDDELFGTFDSVAFTVAEARAAVALVDTASAATLKDSVKLDPRAVNSILAARPLLTMARLADLYYVGPAMMTKIRAYSATPAPCTDDALIAQLTTAIDGVWLTSESDYPLQLVSYPGQGAVPSAEGFRTLIGVPATTPVRVGSFDQMMTRLGYSNEQAKVDALRALFTQNVTGIVVYEVGTIQVHDYIVGVTRCGGLVGVTAISIET